MSSNIDTLGDLLNEHDVILPTTDDYRDSIFNFSLPQEERIEALNRFHAEYPDESLEVLKKLTSIYSLSGVSLLQRFLYEMILHSTLPLLYRLDCARLLCETPKGRDLGLKSLCRLCEDRTGLPSVYALDMILYLYNSDAYTIDAHQFLLSFLTDTTIDCAYRYRTILGLETSIITDGLDVMKQCCLLFVQSTLNDIRFRILGCQNLLSKCPVSDEERCALEELLFSFAEDTSLEMNARADSVDVLLRHAQKKCIPHAEKLLRELGGKSISIYDNQQNAHMKEVEKSSLDILRAIDTCELQPIPSFEVVQYNIQQLAKRRYRTRYQVERERHVKTNIEDFVRTERHYVFDEKESDEETKIDDALLRISLDRTTFSELNYSLCDVLLRIYAYSQHHHAKQEMENRLLEELVDMAGTCTTGYINRLVNTLSGFGFSLAISWEDQITANLTGRLNARVRDMKNEDLRDTILDEMTNAKIEDRTHFNQFFIQHISSIKEEMYQEFREYMSDSDWDLYMKRALTNYQHF